MRTQKTKSELIAIFEKEKGELVITDNKVIFRNQNSPIYYHFVEVNGVMITDYMWSQKTGKVIKGWKMFWNFFNKHNL